MGPWNTARSLCGWKIRALTLPMSELAPEDMLHACWVGTPVQEINKNWSGSSETSIEKHKITPTGIPPKLENEQDRAPLRNK